MFDSAPLHDVGALQQSEAFERALISLGTPAHRLADGTLALQRQLGPLPVHMITRAAPQSPQELIETAKSLQAKGPVILAPDTPMPLHKYGAVPLVSPSGIAQIDLNPDIDTLHKGLHQKWRNRLKHARRQSLRLTRQNMPDDPDHWLLQADALQQTRRRYRSWPIDLTLAYGRENRGQSKLFTAFWGREPVAAILILRHGTSATYHIGHARASGRIASAHTLLLWSAITWCKAKGVERLELGVVDTEEGQGLARFKLGTGAQVRPLGGTWIYWPPFSQLLRPVAHLDRRLMGSI
ncbi:hypothetical protein ROLI_019160 [Roseobacter fucihabitans]|uniref:BioF2-like acetyltransferase domain-containing protein n=1 Tax=Roseobacter fucihabitans TaxID=1537242 RepID=A0ABZ2BTU7_9RHOB|nr:GNAT family N-acetyltransferase [Roseobacter litoralis]MBC6967562.1 FemAB family protein [Roseobacter litoralis]